MIEHDPISSVIYINSPMKTGKGTHAFVIIAFSDKKKCGTKKNKRQREREKVKKTNERKETRSDAPVFFIYFSIVGVCCYVTCVSVCVCVCVCLC